MEVRTIVEQCLSAFGIKGFQNLNRSKSAIAVIKKDLTALMTTLNKNVSISALRNVPSSFKN